MMTQHIPLNVVVVTSVNRSSLIWDKVVPNDAPDKHVCKDGEYLALVTNIEGNV